MVRGIAAVEMARNDAELAKAAVEFRKATELAPQMALAWYNLGAVQVKIGQFKDAITSYKRYLAVSPPSEDTRRIGDEIIKLEYRIEQAQAFNSMTGYWISEPDGKLFKIEANGGNLNIAGWHSSPDSIDYWIDGKSQEIPLLHYIYASLDRREGGFAGSWQVPMNTFPTACTVPAEKAEVGATLDEAKGRLVVTIKRSKHKVVIEDEGPWSAKFRCAEVSVSGVLVEQKVLWGPLPAGSLRYIYGNGQKTLAVGSTDKGSAEELAGLQSGDEIVSIDGKDLARMKNDAARRMLLRGVPGSTVQLVVKRKTTTGGLFASTKEEVVNVSVSRTDVSVCDLARVAGSCSGF